MALDATVGGPNSNSFVTVAEADTYFAQHPFDDHWTNLHVADKEAYLIMATRTLSGLCWTGIGASATQALPWPRIGMYAVTGYALSSSVLPRQLKEMTFELALKLRVDGQSASSSTVDQGLKRAKAGPVEVEYFNPQDLTNIFSLVSSDIKALGVETWFCPDKRKVAEFQVI